MTGEKIRMNSTSVLAESMLCAIPSLKLEPREGLEWIIFRESSDGRNVEYFEIVADESLHFNVAHHKVIAYGDEVEAFTLATLSGRLPQLIPLMTDICNRSMAQR